MNHLAASLKNQIITEFYLGKPLNDMLKKFDAGAGQEDLKSELFSVLCNYPEDKIIQIHESKQLMFFATGIVQRMIFQKNSKFHRTYRKCIYEYEERHDQQHEEYDVEKDKIETEVGEAVDRSLHWVEKSMLQIYLDAGSKKQASRITGISYRQVSNIINKAKRKVQTQTSGKLIGSYLHCNLDIIIDVSSTLDPDNAMDLMDEVHEFIKYRIEGQQIPTKTNQDAFVKEIKPARIKKII